MTSQLLDRSRWCSLHRQVRAERVTQYVNTWLHLSSSRDSSNRHLNYLLRERLPLLVADYTRPTEMPRRLESFGQLLG